MNYKKISKYIMHMININDKGGNQEVEEVCDVCRQSNHFTKECQYAYRPHQQRRNAPQPRRVADILLKDKHKFPVKVVTTKVKMTKSEGFGGL